MAFSRDSRRRLLIIHHADERRVNSKSNLIRLMIPIWKDAGIQVIEVFGVREAPPADVAFLHIDLSVIPAAYLKFARRYPVVINGGVADIRKSRLSVLRVDSRSDYTGPVIIKSALNYAGRPEMRYFRHRPLLQRILVRKPPGLSHPMRIEGKEDYRIYETRAEVPASVWTCQDLVVEKFMPERHDGLYCLREWYFCGPESVQQVELSPDPIFTSGESVFHLDLPLTAEMQALRKRLGFDYGKFDYTMVAGKAMVFDFNKTPGVVNPQDEKALNMARQLAPGLDAFFR